MNDDKLYILKISTIQDDSHYFDIKNIQSMYTHNESHTFTLKCNNCEYKGSKNFNATVHYKLNNAIVYHKLMKSMNTNKCASGHII